MSRDFTLKPALQMFNFGRPLMNPHEVAQKVGEFLCEMVSAKDLSELAVWHGGVPPNAKLLAVGKEWGVLFTWSRAPCYACGRG